MSKGKEQVDAVDHRAAAERALVGKRRPGRAEPSPQFQRAQVHADLAIAQELREANEARRERRASAVEELRRLVEEVLKHGNTFDDWSPRARKTLALFEAADHV